jgi:hypothetical protein
MQLVLSLSAEVASQLSSTGAAAPTPAIHPSISRREGTLRDVPTISAGPTTRGTGFFIHAIKEWSEIGMESDAEMDSANLDDDVRVCVKDPLPVVINQVE